MNKQNKKIFASILFVLISFVSLAQGRTDVPPAPDSRAPGPPGTPIDSGIYILLAIGLIYGVVKMLRAKKA